MIFNIPVAKAGKSVTVQVDTDRFSDETQEAIFQEGLKVCLNSRMTKVGAVTKLEGKELAEANAKALEIANENVQHLYDGTFKFAGTKSKVPAKREVVNEAMRLAKAWLMDRMSDAGMKPSHVAPKLLTAGAKKLIENPAEQTGGDWIKKAEESLAARKSHPTEIIDLAALGIVPDPEKVKKSKEAAVKRRENLSVAQAKGTTRRTTKAKGDKPAKATVEDVIAGLATGAVPHSGVKTAH